MYPPPAWDDRGGEISQKPLLGGGESRNFGGGGYIVRGRGNFAGGVT